jgi:hypothetical protein
VAERRSGPPGIDAPMRTTARSGTRVRREIRGVPVHGHERNRDLESARSDR